MLVAGAAAEVAGDAFADLGLRRLRVVVQEVDGGHDHAGRAVAALQAVFFPEPFLQRVQLVTLGEPFDGDDLGAICLDREDRTRFGAAAIDEHGAGATLARVAADVRASEIELFAQEVHEEHSRLDVALAHLSVHCD